MKVILVLAWLVGLSAVMASFGRPRKLVSRPVMAPGEARMVPAFALRGAPEGYTCGVDKPSEKRDISELEPVPKEFIDRKRLRTRPSTNDFYSCFASDSDPGVSDCEVVLNQVYETEQISVSLNFVANQLITVLDFCVENGDKGVIVGTGPPQWEAGFTNIDDGLPWYDVC
ncbi:hypothetical protein MKZ38_002795 [Zalerion maritima]|uniref:Uncharacterized protein n=1 Tax=Zalerion maritima TaxID=339359 RepID=A0AAD5RPN4_9PEZI|nr:hypothetical protein MKZ38_002795 [Zalerion maritima]